MAQEIKIEHHFLEDSTMVGNNIHFSLAIYYPKNQNLFFPKINESIGNFDIVEKKYFPTQLMDNGFHKDSIIYTFNLFSNKKLNYLDFPIYASNGIDCTKIDLVRDSILLKSSLENSDFNLANYMENLRVEPLKNRPNYPEIMGIGIGFLIFIIIFYSFIKKPFLKYVELIKCWRANRKFKKEFNKNLQELKQGLNKHLIENSFISWKKYMEEITPFPISTYSSKEIIAILKIKKEKKNLNSIDAALYGDKLEDSCLKDLVFLGELADKFYQNRFSEIKENN